MSDDFCLIHGYEHMRREFGNPIPYCEACSPEPAASAEKAGAVESNEFGDYLRSTAPAAPVGEVEWIDCDCRDGGEFRAVCIKCGAQVDPSLVCSSARAEAVKETVERCAHKVLEMGDASPGEIYKAIRALADKEPRQ